MEIFVIYDKTTGLIDGGTGKVDRSAPPDGSTIAERIPLILAKNPNREVIYLPEQKLPNPAKHKIVNGEIVDKTEGEQEEQTISEQAKKDLIDIDIKSIRSIREWLVTQPDAPQYLVDYEAEAIEKRTKLK